MIATDLPLPCLALRETASIPVLTDEVLAHACGVRVAFTARAGGVSGGSYASLNVGGHVGDDPCAVEQNRSRLMYALGASDLPLVVPNQVHGTHVIEVSGNDAAALAQVRAAVAAGADGVVVGISDVAALLCFADCVPLVVVSPTGRFAVVHAGWRGTVAHIASQAVGALAAYDLREWQDGYGAAAFAPAVAGYNAYIGPCIHAECFECGSDVRERFLQEFGMCVMPDQAHVDLPAAVAADLRGAGLSSQRICVAEACTACAPDVWFSYRASGGKCGRHGAIAFKNERVV